jgi:uncharacterized protein YegP (UPF0339 family)
MTFYIYKDRAGLWRWYLTAANNKKVADSAESYYNRQDCLHGIELVKGAWNAPVVEV